MTRARTACLTATLAAACGSEGLPPAELAAVCESEDPVRVLALEPGEVLVGPTLAVGEVLSGSTLTVGGRTIFPISRHEPPDSESGAPQLSFAAVWSTGPCGESPVKLGPDIRDPFTRLTWPGLLFAYSEAGDKLYVVDPLGEAPLHVLFADVGQRVGWTDAGLLSTRPIDEHTDALYLHPWPADPRSEAATPVLLLEGVPHVAVPAYPSPLNVIEPVAGGLLVRTDVGDLVRVSLPDGEVSLVQAGVWDFAASGDGRWIVWQDIKPIETEVEDVFAGEVYLRDTTDDSDTFLAEAALVASWQMFGAGIDLMRLKIGASYEAPERVYSLGTLTSVDLPAGTTLLRVLADGRWLLAGQDGYAVYDPASGAMVDLNTDLTSVVWHDDEGLEVLDAMPCCLTAEARFDQGPLWFVRYNGVRTLLAEQASRYIMRLADGRHLTTLDLGNAGLGQLVVVGPDAQTATHIDDHVFLGPRPSLVHDGAVLYSVDDGERSGVWLARPAE